MPFERAVADNAAMVARVLTGGPGAVMSFEPSSPMYTLGRRASGGRDEGALLPSLALCRQRGIGVTAADRGGLGTLHLPGQLVVFVAVACKRERIPRVVEALLEAAAALGSRQGHSCVVRPGAEAGVFLGPHGDEPEGAASGKLASIGMRHAGGVLRHGMSLNVSVDLDLAAGLTLCGHDDRGVANLPCGPNGPMTVEAVACELAALLGLRSMASSRGRP